MRRSPPCKHCGYVHTRIANRMKNVDRYVCPRCKKVSIYPKAIADGVEIIQKSAYPNAKYFYVFNHQGKADAYVDALKPKYFALEGRPGRENVLFVLTDNDVLHRVHRLDRIRKNGTQLFFVYPHAARTNLFNDIYPEWIYTTAQFVPTQGHAEVLRSFGYSKPIHPVGWSLSPVLPFSPKVDFKNVLFAPIHPKNDECDKKINRATFDKLSSLAIKGEIHLTIRYISNLCDSGLGIIENKNIKYLQGNLNGSNDWASSYDVIVGHQTVAWKSVAMGVPTLMMGERELVSHVMTNPVKFVRSWDKYKDLLCYPEEFDILCKEDTLSLLENVSKGSKIVENWKTNMIGNPFDKNVFSEILESYV